MKELLREVLQQNGVVIAIAMICGASAVLGSALPAVVFVGLVFVVSSAYFPALPVGFAFLGVLLDAQGMTAVKVFGLPLTLSKVGVLTALGAHFLNAILARRPLIQWTPVTGSLFLVILSMILSTITAMIPSEAYVDTAGVIMLTLLVHLVYRAVPGEHMPILFRFMALSTTLVMAWTLAVQRKGVLSGTLDYAWHQRTSGAFGDPNAWSTCLLVICPFVIGALAQDRHWLAKPLIIGLGATFPACILQSVSRAGLIGLVVVTPGILYLLRKERTLLMGAGFALMLILPLVMDLEAAMLRYQTLVDPTMESSLGHGSLTERKALLLAGLKIFSEHPILGVGVGMFRLHASYVSAGEVWKIAHNSYLNVAAEQGIPGIITHLYFGFTVANAAWNAAMHSRTEYFRSAGMGFLLSLAAFSAMALTLNLATFAVAYFMLGLGLAVGRVGQAEHAPADRRGLHDLKPVAAW